VIVGEVLPENLPKQVNKALKNQFGKDDIVLVEKKPGAREFPHDKFFVIKSGGNDSDIKGYLHYGRVMTCRSGVCSMPDEKVSGVDSEYFDYMIFFNPSVMVENIRVFNYQASYGHEITARGWLRQFQGFSGEKSLNVGKNIDAISGATVSVHAITDDVQWKTSLLKKMLH
jgi:hypothetical protein